MAVEVSYDATAAATDAADEAVTQAAPADPAVLGLLAFSVGGTVLGASLLGYVSAAAQGGSVMPIVLAATGLGVFITTVWAAALGQTFVAAVFGAFTGFWWSYAALVLGLAHNWFGIPVAQVSHAVAQFLFAWAIVILCLAAVSTRVPSAYTAILSMRMPPPACVPPSAPGKGSFAVANRSTTERLRHRQGRCFSSRVTPGLFPRQRGLFAASGRERPTNNAS